MFSSVKFVKNVESNLSELFEVLFGETIDEYGEEYVDVYNHELHSFVRRLEESVDALIEAKLPISYIELRSLIISIWGLGIYGTVDFDKLDNLIIQWHNQSLKEETELCKLSDNLTTDENDFIKDAIKDATKYAKKTLIDGALKKDPLMETLNNLDQEKYNKYIQRLISDYINGTNALYKLYRISPKDYELDYGLHINLLKYYGLTASSFSFE